MLKNVKVLDMSRVLAGPLCTMMLGDMGAEVLKVERPLGGDETRGWGPPFDERGISAYYLSVNRNKLGIDLDLDAPGDRTLLLSLAAGADVVVENFRPGVLARRGLDSDTVCARCVKSPLWRPTTGPLTEGTSLPLPCPEPCSVVVSLCREAALWEEGPPAFAAENLTVAWAAFDQPGNEIREAYLRAHFPEKWLLNPEPRTSRVLPSEHGDEPAPPNPGAR